MYVCMYVCAYGVCMCVCVRCVWNFLAGRHVILCVIIFVAGQSDSQFSSVQLCGLLPFKSSGGADFERLPSRPAWGE